MTKLRRYISIYLSLLPKSERKKLPIMYCLILSGSLLELAGIGLVLPFFAVAIGDKNRYLASLPRSVSEVLNNFSQMDLILILGATFLAIFLIKTYVTYLINVKIARFAYHQDTLMRVHILSKLSHGPHAYHLDNDRSKIISILVNNVNKYSTSLLANLKILSELVIAVMLLSVLLFMIPQATLTMITVVTPCALAYLLSAKTKSSKWGELLLSSNRMMLKWIQETIEGLKELRVFGVIDNFIDRLNDAGNDAEIAGDQINRITIQPRYFLEAGLVTFFVTFVLIGVRFENDKEVLLQSLVLLAFAGFRLLPSVTILLSSFTMSRQAYPFVSQIYDELASLERFGHNLELGSSQTLPDKFIGLSFVDLEFRFRPDTPLIFNKANFEIRPMETVGIIGQSGAGKSTLVDLMLGNLVPQSGKLIVSDVEITGRPNAISTFVAYIPQTNFISDDSILHNIALGIDPKNIDHERVDFCVQMANLSEFIGTLRDGVDTIVGDRGISLSGGQRQRIAIARALYFDRQILIFDEATSALDGETENEIVEAIRSLIGTRTIIIIAHRMSTLKYCDRVLEIKEGSALVVDQESLVLGP